MWLAAYNDKRPLRRLPTPRGLPYIVLTEVVLTFIRRIDYLMPLRATNNGVLVSAGLHAVAQRTPPQPRPVCALTVALPVML